MNSPDCSGAQKHPARFLVKTHAIRPGLLLQDSFLPSRTVCRKKRGPKGQRRGGRPVRIRFACGQGYPPKARWSFRQRRHKGTSESQKNNASDRTGGPYPIRYHPWGKQNLPPPSVSPSFSPFRESLSWEVLRNRFPSAKVHWRSLHGR